jgi:hypothetical protein
VPPADGMQEYDFVAQPPEPGTIVTQALAPISTEHVMDDMPMWVRGVRVYASSNNAEKTI